MLKDLLIQRNSVRQFQDRTIPPEVIEAILEAGRLSPSGGNEQPWIFGVVTDKDQIGEITQIAARQMWLAHAPLLIILCTVFVDDIRGGRDIQCERFPEYAPVFKNLDQGIYWALNQEEHQTKIAGTHMVLAALGYGMGSCWVSRFDVVRLAKYFNLPSGVLPSEILAMGYPAGKQKLIPKKSLVDLVFYGKY